VIKKIFGEFLLVLVHYIIQEIMILGISMTTLLIVHTDILKIFPKKDSIDCDEEKINDRCLEINIANYIFKILAPLKLYKICI
jgi:hypothetical protein